jgi:hypothetical protein
VGLGYVAAQHALGRRAGVRPVEKKDEARRGRSTCFVMDGQRARGPLAEGHF